MRIFKCRFLPIRADKKFKYRAKIVTFGFFFILKYQASIYNENIMHNWVFKRIIKYVEDNFARY